MKFIYRYFAIVLALIVLSATNIETFAMQTSFSTKELSEKEANTFLSNVNLSLLYEEPDKTFIECFDVNSNHVIALGHKHDQRKSVCVYSNDGVFQYGYEFNCSGSFGLEWDDDKINIYFTRSDVVISVNSEGEVLDLVKVKDTDENNKHRNRLLNSVKRVVGGTEYLLKNDIGVLNIFSSSYSQLSATNSTGDTIVYEAEASEATSRLIKWILGVVIFISVLVLTVYQIIKPKDRKRA